MRGQAKAGYFEMFTDKFVLQLHYSTFVLIFPNLYYILLYFLGLPLLLLYLSQTGTQWVCSNACAKPIASLCLFSFVLFPVFREVKALTWKN